MKTLSQATLGLWLTLAMTSLAGGACAQHAVGGKTAQDAFSDAALAQLADSACQGDRHAVASQVRDGANPNGEGFEGVTPLAWAITCENAAGVEALLNARANPNHLIGGKFSATYQSSSYRDSVFLRLMLAKGGDPNAEYIGAPHTALSEALSLGIHSDQWDNWEALLDAGADINRDNGLGDTIATDAAALGRFDRVIELLERGYDYDLVGLAETTQVRIVGREFTDTVRDKARVLSMLRERGVTSTRHGPL